MLGKQTVLERLKQVIDPELGVNVVDLGLIYKVEVKKRTLRLSGASHSTRSAQAFGSEAAQARRGDKLALKSLASLSSKKVDSYKVKILMTLTTPGCPLAPVIESLVRRALGGLEGMDIKRDVTIELTFDPPWTIEMMTEEVRAELGFD